jgi:hypothetical protein
MAITAEIRDFIMLSGNPVYVNVAGGTIPAGATEYKYIIKIESADSKLIGAPYYDAITPDSQMEASFNIQGYVDQPVANVFQWPLANACISRNDVTFHVNVYPGERYIDSNGTLVESIGATAEEVYIFKGGVSPRQQAMWNSASTGFETVYLQNNLFLTQRPSGDYVHAMQPVKLWFLSVVGGTASKLNLKYYYNDGSMTEKIVSVSMGSNYTLYELNVGPLFHGIATAGLSYFDASLYLNSTLASDVRRFTIDQRACERPFFLLFKNSLGGIDDVYLSGYATEGFDTEGTPVYKPQQPADTVFERTLDMPNRQGRNTFSINTGYKTTSQMLHLRDMLLSREVWLLYPNGGVTSWYVIPVNITSGTAKLINRADDLYAMQIEMEEAHNSRFNFDNRLY